MADCASDRESNAGEPLTAKAEFHGFRNRSPEGLALAEKQTSQNPHPMIARGHPKIRYQRVSRADFTPRIP